MYTFIDYHLPQQQKPAVFSNLSELGSSPHAYYFLNNQFRFLLSQGQG